MEKTTKQKFYSSNYLPATGVPVVSETFGRFDWVQFGPTNLFPQEILDLYNNASPLHTGLIKLKVDMIASLGFNPIESLKPFLANEFAKEDLDKIAYKVAFDLVLFGGYYLIVTWDKSGKQIAKIEHVGFEKVRAQKPCAIDYFGEENLTDDIINYYVSRDWSKFRKTENEPKLIPAFDARLSKDHPTQIMGVMSYSPGMDFYSLPDYKSVVTFLQIIKEIGVSEYKTIVNNFAPGMVITMFDPNPLDEEREAEYQDLKERYTKSINHGDFLLVYAENQDRKPTFEPIQHADNTSKYKDMIADANQQILVAHRASPIIGGIAEAGKLGNTTEIKEAFQNFQLTKIAGYQKMIEDTFNELAKINGYEDKLELQPYSILSEEVPTQDATALATINNIKKIIN